MSIDIGATRRRSNFAAAAALSAVIVVGALIVNPYWIYSGRAWPDPYEYYGFLIDFARAMKLEGGHWYLGTRLGWILPGVLVNALASPPVAYFILHNLMFFAFILIHFLLLRKWLSPTSAAIGTILAATSTQVLMVFSWSYTQAAALTYWISALLVAREASERRSNFRFLASGALFCLAVMSHQFMIFFLPSFHFVLKEKPRPKHWLSWSAGFLAVFAGLIAVFAAYTNSWNWFRSAWACVKLLLANKYGRPERGELSHLTLWAALGVVGLSRWLSTRPLPGVRAQFKGRPFQALFVYLTLLYVLLYALGLHLVLDHFMYTVFAIPVLCGYAAELYEAKSGGGAAWEAATVGLLLFFGLIAVRPDAARIVDRFFPHVSDLADFFLPLGGLSILMTGFLSGKSHRALALAAIPAIGIANIHLAPGHWKGKVQMGVEKRDFLGLIGQCHEVVRKRAEDPTRQVVWGAWSRTREPGIHVLPRNTDAFGDGFPDRYFAPSADAIAWSFYPSDILISFPFVFSDSMDALSPGKELILVTKDCMPVEELNRALKEYGVSANTLDQAPVSYGAQTVCLGFYRLTEMPESNVR